MAGDDETKPPIKKLKLKKNWRTDFVSPTGYSITEIYCRRCVQYKNPKDFAVSHDNVLDKNGMMSICRECCDSIYQDNLRSERDIHRAILKTCRTLNWTYNTAAVDGTIEKVKNIIEKNPDSKALFTTTYWGIIQSMSNISDKTSIGNILTFVEPIVGNYVPAEFTEDIISQEVVDFWGSGYPTDDYRFMENQFANFKKTHKIESYSEVVLCKEVVYEMLNNKKARVANGSVDSKRLESLMKSLAISPNMTNASQSSKSMDTFSAFIKQIEETRPAEFYKDKKMFKDFDNMEWYFDKFVRRPIKNFFGLSRDFNISDENSDAPDSEDDFEQSEDELTLKNIKENSETK